MGGRKDKLDEFLSYLDTKASISGENAGYINFSEKISLDEFTEAAKESGLKPRIIFRDDEMGILEVDAKGRGLTIGALFSLESGVYTIKYCYFKRT